MPDGRWLDGVLYDDMHDSAGLLLQQYTMCMTVQDTAKHLSQCEDIPTSNTGARM